jgi:hypothetical protein
MPMDYSAELKRFLGEIQVKQDSSFRFGNHIDTAHLLLEDDLVILQMRTERDDNEIDEEIVKRYYFRTQDFFKITQYLMKNESYEYRFKGAYSEFNWIHDKGNYYELNEMVQIGRITGVFHLKEEVLDTYNIVFEPSGKETRWSGLREYNTHHLEEYNKVVREGLGII